MPTLNWIGKDKIINHHQEVPYKVLNHEYGFSENEKSKAPVASGNLIINGDNLEALKSLLPKYEGKVNCIYIDPPYNTGNESWVYNDNVNSPKIKKWLGKVVGKESEDLTRHDKWLCMMYPRIKLLHKLLAKDGFIFISLDDNEIHSLKFILNEIFGEKNFQAEIIVQSNKRGQTYKQLAKTHEYLICFSKTDKANINELPTDIGNYPYQDSIGKYSIRELRNRNPKFGRFNRPNLFFPIYINPNAPDDIGFCPLSLIKDEDFSIEVLPLNSQSEESCWRWGTKKVEENILFKNDMSSIFGRQKQDGNWGVYDKYRKGTVKAKTIWTETEMISEQGTSMLRNLGLAELFQFPKPVELIKRVLLLASDENSIVLDSFAGSGTTAHSVLELNKQDGGNRKFILIEMEDYAETITAERVKRVINGYADKEGTGGSFDYYTLGEPLFDENNNLNETVGIEKIREYVWFTETRISYTIQELASPFLGIYNDTSYYFIYEKDNLTTLDYESLAEYVQQKAERYIIYADNCLLPETFMRAKNIEFKKIPRDITRF
ncbi:site-specific DNA-methyltransferase [Flavobacterium sp. LS1P3]|uniref:site-specific DNA-methyltransferase n=1 Tax=Flavobacterium sp. LS1P3 TaxID=3401720 RepID=UPI003AAF2598